MRNVIYVTSEDAWLRKDGENVVVEIDGAERGRAPLHMLEGIATFGRVGASPALMHACAEAGIALSFLDPNGRFLARIEGPRSGNVLLRRAQHRAADAPEARARIARAFVAAKAANQRAVVRRGLRDHGDGMAPDRRARLEEAERRLGWCAERALASFDVDAIRGFEGDAAATYFASFDALVTVEDPAFAFLGRSRRPPLDRINALLSFLYALLGHDCRRLWRPTDSTLRSASCMRTGRAGRGSRST